jgi:peroxiredoxin
VFHRAGLDSRAHRRIINPSSRIVAVRAHQGGIMQATAGPNIGEQAPEFKLKGPGGQVISLSEYLGRKNVVLVFFPLAFSPVCSHQLPSIEKEMSRFRDLSTEVLGISVDSHFANEAFAERLRLSFPLLSDFRHAASKAYGVFDENALMSGRAVFVVDKQGLIAYKDISPDVRQVPSNAGILEALARLQS